jgi:hypothetical protein
MAVLIVTALFHYLRVFEASLSCPERDGHTGVVLRGGWGSGSTCRYEFVSGTNDSYSVDSKPLNWIVPWWSTAVSLLVILTLGALLFIIVRSLWRWSQPSKDHVDHRTDAGDENARTAARR